MNVQMDSTQVLLYVSAFFMVVLWFSHKLIHLVAITYGKWRLHRKMDAIPSSLEKPLPGVSILKPLVNSSDPHLPSNLETFFTLNYPKYEIIFCVQDVGDTRLRMHIDTLRAKYPTVDTQVFYGGQEVGVNPKINNMHPGYQASKYELILVSDSGIRMKEDTLTDMVFYMTEKVGLVHQMPFSCDRSGTSAAYEKVFFGTYHARMYLSANLLGINCATGMSSLMRKEILEAAGGMQAFANYLAEDYFFAKAVLKAGLKLDISSQPAWQNPGDSKIMLLHNRIARWTKLRQAMCPHLILLEPFSECMLLGIVSAWAVVFLLNWDPVSFFFIHVFIWLLLDWILLYVVQNGTLPFNSLEFLALWLFREFSALFLFLQAQIHPKIQWRTRMFRLRWGGIAESIEKKGQSMTLAILSRGEPDCSSCD